MKEVDLVSVVKDIVKQRSYTPADLKNKGSVHQTATIVYSFCAGTNELFEDSFSPGSGCFRTARIVELFEDAPGVISASLLIPLIDNLDEGRVKRLDKPLSLIKSDTVPKLIQEYRNDKLDKLKPAKDKTFVPSAALSNIILSADVVFLVSLLDWPPVDIFKVDDFESIYQEFNQHNTRYTNANPVLKDLHMELIQLWANNDKTKNAV